MSTLDFVVNSVFAGIALLLIATCWVIFWRDSKKRPQKTRKIQLSDLAQLWLGKGEVNLAELAPIWCEVAERTDGDPCPVQEFTNDRIQLFYTNHIVAISGDYREVIEELLTILDNEGDCSSVVRVATDLESSWNSTTYELLGKTNLADHSLNVADEAIRMLEEENSRFMIPDMVIAALAHDIGKAPSLRSDLYSLGDHPLTAGRVLIDIEAFNRIPKKEILLKAIKLHHKKPEDLLGKTLKFADQLAREKELEHAQSLLPPRDQPRENYELPCLVMDDLPREKVKKEAFKGMNIPWFDLDSMIAQLKSHINQVDGRRFTAFSMSNGYVYIQPKLIENIAKEQAEKGGTLDVVTMEKEDMQKVLVSIAQVLREKELLAKEFVKTGFYASYFTIVFKGGNELKGYYTPFHAEAFGSIGEMEPIKNGILLDFASVTPYKEKEK